MDAFVTTSFDRYARYSYIRSLRTHLPSRSLRVLDVGDPYGTLAQLLPEDHTVSLDLFSERLVRDARHDHVIGSGFELPFPDGAFDVVATHDVLEHVPADGREEFLSEILRVSGGPVVVVAPFDDPRTVRCEEIVNAYYVAHLGSTLEPLDEHADGGLPDETAVARWLDRQGVQYAVHSDGWLYHWLAFMLLKAHFVSMGTARLDQAVDEAFNRLLRERDAAAPHYRRAFVLRPPAAMPSPAATTRASADVSGDCERLTALGWELAAVLRRGEDPSAPTSSLRDWIARHADDDGPSSEVATSLRIVLDEAERILARPSITDIAGDDAPTRLGVVLLDDGDEGDLELALSRLAEEDVPVGDVVVAVPRTVDPQAVAGARRVIIEDDRVLRINGAIDAIDAELVLLLDTSVDPGRGFLTKMRARYDEVGKPSCVGLGDADDAFLARVGLRRDGDSSLFAPTDVLLIERALYQNLGGIDGSLRGHLDDVDLGWRLWSSGHQVILAGDVVSRARPALDPRRLEESYLRLLLKNYDHQSLSQVLASDLLLQSLRTAGAAIHIGDAVTDVVRDIDGIIAARQAATVLRRRWDAALFARFGRPALACDVDDTTAALVDRVGTSLTPSQADDGGPTRVLVVEGARPERARAIAALVAQRAEVVTATFERRPTVSSHPIDAVRTVTLRQGQDDLAAAASTFDVVVVPVDVAAMTPALAQVDVTLVVDLGEELPPDAPPDLDGIALRRGDSFICGSEQQRTYWLARLEAVGRPLPSERESDMTLRRLVDVTPGPSGVRPPIIPSHPRVLPGRLFALVDLAETEDDLSFAAAFLAGFRDVQEQGFVAHLGVTAGVGRPVPDAFLDLIASDIAAERMSVHQTEDEAARHRLLSEADLVVRPTGTAPHVLLRTPAPVIEALCSGTPVVVAAHDPGAFLIADGRTGFACIPSRLLADTHRLLADDELRKSFREELAATGGPGWPSHTSPLLAVVDAPWRWYRAHRGGVPLGTTLLAPAPPATQHPTAAHHRDHRRDGRAIDRLLQKRTKEAAELDRTVRHLTEELERERQAVERLRRHPVVRAARLVRRIVAAR